MLIDGRAIADKILDDLKPEVAALKAKGVTPTMAVILVSDDPASLSYIKQKQKAAETIGAKVILEHLPSHVTWGQLKQFIEKYNNDSTVHGLIVQRPLPPQINLAFMYQFMKAEKDIDGFVPGSKFPIPVAAAVLTILENVYFLMRHSRPSGRLGINSGGNPALINNWIPDQARLARASAERVGDDKLDFDHWLKTQRSAVLGRGETAGKPISEALAEHGCMTSVIHSQTPDPSAITKKMTIVVSCVGKEKVITRQMLVPETILISVGLWRDSSGKLHGDYEEDEIKDVASFYTPTPGGVGPVNVASLMKNLVLAARKSS